MNKYQSTTQSVTKVIALLSLFSIVKYEAWLTISEIQIKLCTVIQLFVIFKDEQ